uniref:Uncharacterized protein n=1 Tax=Anguilla anguilla TaxID=7936 RepID=A0A0E9QRI5_ANGAN
MSDCLGQSRRYWLQFFVVLHYLHLMS